MNYFYFYFFAIITFLLLLYFIYKNNFVIENPTIHNNVLLLGDNYLHIKSNYQIYNYAKNDTFIKHADRQLELVNFDVSYTYIFISFGRNDIIQHCFHMDNKYIIRLFEKYKKFISKIKSKFPQAKLTIINLYLPLKSHYKKYYNSINLWNNLIETNQNLGYKVLQTNILMTSPTDFIYELELSQNGLQKLTQEMDKFINPVKNI
jgi:hypothetical protein